MEVGKNGVAMFELDAKGRPQVFYYGNIREPASFAAHTHVSFVPQAAPQCCMQACCITCNDRHKPQMSCAQEMCVHVHVSSPTDVIRGCATFYR